MHLLVPCQNKRCGKRIHSTKKFLRHENWILFFTKKLCFGGELVDCNSHRLLRFSNILHSNFEFQFCPYKWNFSIKFICPLYDLNKMLSKLYTRYVINVLGNILPSTGYTLNNYNVVEVHSIYYICCCEHMLFKVSIALFLSVALVQKNISELTLEFRKASV